MECEIPSHNLSEPSFIFIRGSLMGALILEQIPTPVSHLSTRELSAFVAAFRNQCTIQGIDLRSQSHPKIMDAAAAASGFTSHKSYEDFVSSLKEQCVQLDIDFRAQGHQDSMALAAKALGFSSYLQYESHQNRETYVSLLVRSGFSEQYASAQMLSRRTGDLPQLIADLESKLNTNGTQPPLAHSGQPE